MSLSLLLLIISGLLAFLAGSGLLAARRWRRLAAAEPRVLMSGGGTGGHVNPGLAIAEGIKAREPGTKFLYVGVKGKAETVIVSRAGYPLRFVSSEGFPGFGISFGFCRFLVKLSIGVVQSVFILFSFSPRWVIATGGYVSAPVIAAALILKKLGLAPVRIFLHEQNSVPGQLNALLGRWVDKVLLTFPQTISFFPRNGIVVGYPIRHSIAPVPPEEALKRLSFHVPPGREVIFAFGGSQGSRTINRSVVDALRYLLPHRDRIFLIHGMGLARSEDYDAVADTESRLDASYSPEEKALFDSFYYRQDYFHNIAEVYSISTLIVCRSGAGSLNEISRIGKPAVLIPKANLPGDHQVMNARTMKCAGAAEVLFEDTIIEDGQLLEKLEGSLLADRIMNLLDSPEKLRKMEQNSTEFLRRRAVERILDELWNGSQPRVVEGFQPVPFQRLLPNSRLLQLLSAEQSRSGRQYDPLDALGDPDDLEYYRHRAAALLSHKAWQDRNLGVKLIGYTKYNEKISTLLHMLTDRKPAPPIRRLFGGDFEQVGFIRRNVVQALMILDCFDPDVERALLTAMDDPYFEVRVQACKAVAHFGRYLAGNQGWVEAVGRRLKDKCFEVVIEAVKALGEIGTGPEEAQALLALGQAHYWQVRNAALLGLRRLVERGVVCVSPELLSGTGCFILTSTDFKPHFSIKETYKAVRESCKGGD